MPRPKPKVELTPAPLPSPETSIEAIIERAAGMGLTPVQIIILTGVAKADLDTIYADAIRRGEAKAHLRVATALFDTAVDRKHSKHVTAAIFWAKARLGWRDGGGAAADEGPSATGPDPMTDEEIAVRFDETMKALRGE